jgi:glycosyltransferase involved in cell wall biosynthesis
VGLVSTERLLCNFLSSKIALSRISTLCPKKLTKEPTEAMKRLKVLHIVPMLGPGGAERVAVDIVMGLNRQRFEVAIVSIWGRVGCELEDALDHSDVGVEYLGKGAGFDGRIYRKMHQVLKNHRPDIVHTHLHVLHYALPSLLLVRHTSWLHTVHNLAEREIEPRARCIQRYAFKHGVVPVGVSEEVALSLKRLYGIQQCCVVRNGIPTNHYAQPKISRSQWRAAEGFREEQVLFVCVARFAPQKNHALLLKAFSQGPASDPNAHLVLVGDGILCEQLKELAKSLGLADQVHFLGLRTDIPDVLGAMDVFALSSDWEGNPLSVMEAMAAGLPIVSTAVGGVPDLFANGKEGFLVPQGDAQGLVNCMNSLLSKPEARQSMGAAAAGRARQSFDVLAMIGAYEELYENLTNDWNRQNVNGSFPRHTIDKVRKYSCCARGCIVDHSAKIFARAT